jgi:tetratricopeptide (TPR) repeat protein
MAWSDGRVRKLLRKLRTPGAVHRDELAQALHRLTGAPNAHAAVLAVAERALQPYPAVYLTVFRRADVGGESTTVIADDLHLSPRSFFRYRAAAVAAIAAEIDALTRTVPVPAAPFAPADLDAIALHARGRYLFNRRTGASLRAALRCFDRALDADPAFARAYAGLAGAHVLMGEYLVREPAPAFRDAQRALASARALDGALPAVHVVLGELAVLERRDLRAARASVDAALAADPGYAPAHELAALLAMIEGDDEGALQHVQAGLEREPDALELHVALARAYTLGGRADRALTHLADVLDLDPAYSCGRFELVHALVSAGRFADASAQLRILIAAEPRVTYEAALCYAEAQAGNRDPARRYLAAPEVGGRTDPHRLRALVHVGLGRYDDALRELRAAVRRNEPCAITIRADNFFRPLHRDREFHAIVAEAAERPQILRLTG